MTSIALLMVTAACISSPLEPDQSNSTPDPGGVSIAPGQVWLFPGQAQALGVELSGDVAESDSVSFAWFSSDPSIVEVDQEGTLSAKRPGAVEVRVEASFTGTNTAHEKREAKVSVGVASSEQEANVATVLGVPRLEDIWSGLAYSGRYDELFVEYGDDHWSRSGGEWENTYYDRGLAWFAAWWRTGDGRYLDRAGIDVTSYRDNYVLANDGAVTPKWAFPEGLSVHYFLTGDETSRQAVVMMADHLRSWVDGRNDILTTSYRDGRIQGRAVLTQLMAYLVTDDESYREAARIGVERLLTWYEAAGSNGAWDSSALPNGSGGSDNLYCGGMATFQIAHAILEVMIRYHDLIDPDPRIPAVVETTLDRSWSSYWQPGGGFAYIQPPQSFNGTDFVCEGSGTNGPAKDLTLLILTTFGDAYRISGEERFRMRGDEVLEYGLSGAIHLRGDKQFNQSFMRSYRYLYATG